jgi:hypothetical protein
MLNILPQNSCNVVPLAAEYPESDIRPNSLPCRISPRSVFTALPNRRQMGVRPVHAISYLIDSWRESLRPSSPFRRLLESERRRTNSFTQAASQTRSSMKEMRSTYLVEIRIADGSLVRSETGRRMEAANLALTLMVASKGVIMAESTASLNHAIALAETARQCLRPASTTR